MPEFVQPLTRNLNQFIKSKQQQSLTDIEYYRLMNACIIYSNRSKNANEPHRIGLQTTNALMSKMLEIDYQIGKSQVDRRTKYNKFLVTLFFKAKKARVKFD